MSLTILFYFFYIINIPKYVSIQEIENIDVNSCKSDEIYDSMTYQCIPCGSYKNGNNCYSNSPIKSLYSDNDTIFENGIPCNKSDQTVHITELDNKGNLLGYLMCANTTITKVVGNSFTPLPNSLNNNINPSFTINEYSNFTRPERSVIQPLSVTFQNFNEIKDYYYNSCIDGNYQKSCQYFINLCVVAMYDSKNFFCKIIENLDKNKFSLNNMEYEL